MSESKLKCEDLKVRNLVEFWHKKEGKTYQFIQIEGVEIDNGVNSGIVKIHGEWQTCFNIRPIEISGLKLLQLGFSKKPVAGCGDYYYINNDDFEIGWDEDSKTIDVAFCDQNSSVEFPHVKYVHTLQNFYLALKSEELIYKE